MSRYVLGVDAEARERELADIRREEYFKDLMMPESAIILDD